MQHNEGFKMVTSGHSKHFILKEGLKWHMEGLKVKKEEFK